MIVLCIWPLPSHLVNMQDYVNTFPFLPEIIFLTEFLKLDHYLQTKLLNISSVKGIVLTTLQVTWRVSVFCIVPPWNDLSLPWLLAYAGGQLFNSQAVCAQELTLTLIPTAVQPAYGGRAAVSQRPWIIDNMRDSELPHSSDRSLIKGTFWALLSVCTQGFWFPNFTVGWYIEYITILNSDKWFWWGFLFCRSLYMSTLKLD